MNKRVIYLVDDNRVLLILISKLLEREGFVVKPFENANCVLDAITEKVPDLIISDIEMPETNGVTLFDEAQDLVKGIIRIPFLYISSSIDKELLSAAYSRSKRSVIAKTGLVKPLTNAVREILKDINNPCLTV